MKVRAKITSFVLALMLGLVVFGCYTQGPEIQPTPGQQPTQQDPSKPKPKPTPEKPATQQEPIQQQG
jgi:hypothetical protein